MILAGIEIGIAKTVGLREGGHKSGSSLYEVVPKFGGDLYIYGIIFLSRGFMISCMILFAMMVFVVEREFLKVALWTATAAVLSFFGVIHAYVLTPTGIQNNFGFGVARDYALATLDSHPAAGRSPLLSPWSGVRALGADDLRGFLNIESVQIISTTDALKALQHINRA